VALGLVGLAAWVSLRLATGNPPPAPVATENLLAGDTLAHTLAQTGALAAPRPSPQRAAELENLVRQDCGSCHGMTLKGGLGPDLRPLTLAGSDPETLAQIILDGVPDRAMPPWRPLLSEADALWIAHYLLKGEKP
jgi:cytochrome c55X